MSSFAEIDLNPLTLHDLQKWLSDSLYQSLDAVKELAIICQEKTEWNPFYFIQFMTASYEKKLIYFDDAKGQWQWDSRKIQNEIAAENVLQLMLDKIKPFIPP